MGRPGAGDGGASAEEAKGVPGVLQADPAGEAEVPLLGVACWWCFRVDVTVRWYRPEQARLCKSCRELSLSAFIDRVLGKVVAGDEW